MYGQAYICYLDKLIMEAVPTLVVPSRDDFIDVGLGMRLPIIVRGADTLYS